MNKKHVVAYFKNEKDLQMAMNSLVQAGFDTTGLSIIMKDIPKSQVKRSEPYDENNAFNEAYGTINPVEGEDLNTETINIPELGEVEIAGPIVKKMDETEFEDNLDNSNYRFDQALKIIGIEDNKLEEFKNRIGRGEILAHLAIEPNNREEIEVLLADAGGLLMERF